MIAIVSPYPPQSSRGNSVSAVRIAGLLGQAGKEVKVMTVDEFVEKGDPNDDLIALHARRSERAILAHSERRAHGAKLIVMLTGSDLHKDVEHSKERAEIVRRSLELADQIVVSQDGSYDVLDEVFKNKTHVIYKSINLPERDSIKSGQDLDSDVFRVVYLAHLKMVKNPTFLESVLDHLPVSSKIRIDHFGEVFDDELGDWAKKFSSSERYDWRGNIDREDVSSEILNAQLTVNVSNVEGGANSIAESLFYHVPVILSDIPANVGMVGSNYLGLYENGNVEECASLLLRCENDPDFYTSMLTKTIERAKLYKKENEKSAWVKLFRDQNM